MVIKINSYVSCRVYEMSNLFFAFIFNEKENYYYFAKGDFAKFFHLLLNNSNSINIDNEYKAFLLCLYKHDIISSDIDFSNIEYKNYFDLIIDKKNKKLSSAYYENYVSFSRSHHKLNTLSLQLSYNCNLKCKHCFNPKSNNNSLFSFKIAKKLIDEAYQLGIMYVGITGGECTVHQDFLEIAKYIRERHLSFFFLTNGIRLYDDETFFDSVVSLYPSQIQLSLYSMEPVIHDSITNLKGSHCKTISVIKKLKDRGINVVINLPVLSLNKNSYVDIIKFADSIDATICFSSVFLNNDDNKNFFAAPSYNEIVEFYYFLIKNKNISRKKLCKDKTFVCNNAGSTILSINPNLDVTPCSDFNYFLGNYKDTSLISIWREVIPEFHKKFIKERLSECFSYEYCKYCSYCPKTAMFDAGFMKKSETLCRHAKAYYEALNRYNEENR